MMRNKFNLNILIFSISTFLSFVFIKQVYGITRSEVVQQALNWEYTDKWNPQTDEVYFGTNVFKSNFRIGTGYNVETYVYGGSDSEATFINRIKNKICPGGNNIDNPKHSTKWFYDQGYNVANKLAGIDCSAFVSSCWNVSRTNASGLANMSIRLSNRSELKPGDILARPGYHVILVLTKPESGKINIAEATPPNVRVVRGKVLTSISSSYGAYTSFPMFSDFSPAEGTIINNASPKIKVKIKSGVNIKASTIVLKIDGVEKTPTLSPSADAKEINVSYTSSEDLSDGEHTVYIYAKNALDLEDDNADTLHRFIIDLPPTVDSPAVAWPTVPKEGARNVSKGTNIVIYFSEKMDKSVEPDIFFTISPEVSGGFSWSEWEVNGSTGSILTFNPEGELETGIYTVNISTEAKDLAGSGLDGDKDGDTGPDYRWSFEVNDIEIVGWVAYHHWSWFHPVALNVPYPNPGWTVGHPQEFNGEVICSGGHPYPWTGIEKPGDKEFTASLTVKIKDYPVEEGTVIDFNPVFIGAGGGGIGQYGAVVVYQVMFVIRNSHRVVVRGDLYYYLGAEYDRVYKDGEWIRVPHSDFHPEKGIKDPEPINLYEEFREEHGDAEIMPGRWEIEIYAVTRNNEYYEKPAWVKIGLNGLNLPGIASNPNSVACLSVIDSPDDTGGKVRASWGSSSDSYFNSYNIYSSVNKIFSIKGLKPVIKIGEMDKNSYDIPALGDGFYYYGVTVENRLKMESNCISSNKAVRAVNNLIDTEESPCTIWSGFDEKTKVIVKQGENNGVYVNILEPEEEKERLITNANVYPPGEAMISLDKGNKLDSTKREFKSSKGLCGRQTISIPYASTIDGYLEENLQVYVLNERDERWEKLPDKCIIDKGEKIVSCEVEGKDWNNGRVYRIYGVFNISSDLRNVVVYPIPYKVGSGGRFGGSGISFKNLTSPAEIRIYNIAGELVFKEKAIDSSGYYEWDITNKDGKQVASGVYVYLITNDLGQKKTGRIAIIK